MKQIIITFLFLLFLTPITKAATFDDSTLWQLHLAYHDPENIVAVGTSLYVVMNGNLLVFDTQDLSVKTIDKSDGLSSKGIEDIAWSDTQKCLVILYDDNNVDLLYQNGDIYNIPQIKNYNDDAITTTNLNVSHQWATISTTKGIILINIEKKEIRGYYLIGEPYDATVIDNNLLASLKTRSLIQGKISDNLYDITQWNTVLSNLDIYEIAPFQDGAYLISPYETGNPTSLSGVLFLNMSVENPVASLTTVTSLWCDHALISNQKPLFTGSGCVITVKDDDYIKEDQRYNLQQSLIAAAYTTEGTIWAINTTDSLINFKANSTSDNLQSAQYTIATSGPRRDYAYKMHYNQNRLLVAGGYQDYSAGTNFPPTAMVYEEGKWTAFQEDNIQLNSNATYTNVYDIAQDPKDATHHFVASRTGLLEFKNFSFQNHYNSQNSPLIIAPGGNGDPNFCIADALAFDEQGNLFLTNYEAKNTLLCFTNDGQWIQFYDDAFTNISTPQKSLIDNDGRLWVTSRRETGDCSAGIYCLDYNQTPSDQSDDQSRFRSNAINEDGTSCTFGNTYDICLDNNGQIWMGTNNGVFVIENPQDFLTSSFTVYQPKVPRNDGTNYADYLLTGTPVSAIAVDGGNRKWFGTYGSGLYLTNEDGTEVLQHFTTDDSPILSDNIWALAVNSDNGTLMIGTDIGICSYQSGITQPQTSLQKQNIKISPNPVRPEYNGIVNITGLTQQAEVKIVTTNHQLVARITAIGGTAQWDIKSQITGQRVAPGIYYVLTTTSDGKTSVAAKIAVI